MAIGSQRFWWYCNVVVNGNDADVDRWHEDYYFVRVSPCRPLCLSYHTSLRGHTVAATSSARLSKSITERCVTLKGLALSELVSFEEHHRAEIGKHVLGVGRLMMNQ
eukprot:scaffold3195_cov162-Amphora_coffeaeformis.AAC.5